MPGIAFSCVKMMDDLWCSQNIFQLMQPQVASSQASTIYFLTFNDFTLPNIIWYFFPNSTMQVKYISS